MRPRICSSDELKTLLAPWPVDRPPDWTDRVNVPLTGKEQERMEASLERSRPFGSDAWVMQTAARLKLGHTLRPEGRPKKAKRPVNTP